MSLDPLARVIWGLLPIAVVLGLSFLPERFRMNTNLSMEQSWGCRDVALAFAVVFGSNLLLTTVELLGRIAGNSLFALEVLSLLPPLLSVAPVGFIVVLRERRSLRSLGITHGRSVSLFCWATGLYFFLVFLWSLRQYFAGRDWSALYTNQLFGNLSHLMSAGQFSLFLLVILAGSSAEEIVFRGFALLPLSRVVSPSGGIVATALFWSMAHFTDPGRTLAYFGEGLLYGWVFHRTGSLIPTLTFHGLRNLGFFSDYAFARLAKAGVHWTREEHLLYVGVGSVAVASVAIIVAILARRTWRLHV